MITTLMSNEQFKQLCEHLEGPAGCNFRHRPYQIPTRKGKLSRKQTRNNEIIWDCDNALTHTVAWMEAHSINVRSNIERIYDLGGHCDCEVLFNTSDKWEQESNPEWPKYFTADEWKERIDWKIEQAKED